MTDLETVVQETVQDDAPLVKYMHYQVDEKRRLTIATRLYRDESKLIIGYTVQSPKDRYDRKIGNQIAYRNMLSNPIELTIVDEALIFHAFFAWYSVEHIFMQMLAKDPIQYPESVVADTESLCDFLLTKLKNTLAARFDKMFEEIQSDIFLNRF